MADSDIISYAQYDEETGEKLHPIVVLCCDEPLDLWSSWANECPHCHCEWNGSGQRLAPRHFWGEETGERF